MGNDIYEGKEPYIFISYAHHDASEVLPVIEDLQQNGFRVWYDRGIEVGTEWPEYIAEHLTNADSVIVFMSKAASESRNCRREINFSIELGKEPIVVYLENVELTPGMKLQLNTLQAIYKNRSSSRQEFSQQLCKASALQRCRIGASADSYNNAFNGGNTVKTQFGQGTLYTTPLSNKNAKTATYKPNKSFLKTLLWIFGWIFIFPVPVTVLLRRKKTMKPILKYGLIILAWYVYLRWQVV